MKKFLALFICLFITPFCACKKQPEKYDSKITQLRENIFFAENEQFTLICYPEKRESPIENDGFVGKVENFVIFKLNFKNSVFKQPYDISFKIADESYIGKFDYKPIADKLECCVKVNSLDFEQLFTTLSAENSSVGITLLPKKNSSTVDCKDALELLKQNDEDSKKILSLDNCEIRIRLINNDGYDYWYIGLISTEDKVSYLLDGENGELLAKKDLI